MFSSSNVDDDIEEFDFHLEAIFKSWSFVLKNTIKMWEEGKEEKSHSKWDL